MFVARVCLFAPVERNIPYQVKLWYFPVRRDLRDSAVQMPLRLSSEALLSSVAVTRPFTPDSARGAVPALPPARLHSCTSFLPGCKSEGSNITTVRGSHHGNAQGPCASSGPSAEPGHGGAREAVPGHKTQGHRGPAAKVCPTHGVEHGAEAQVPGGDTAHTEGTHEGSSKVAPSPEGLVPTSLEGLVSGSLGAEGPLPCLCTWVLGGWTGWLCLLLAPFGGCRALWEHLLEPQARGWWRTSSSGSCPARTLPSSCLFVASSLSGKSAVSKSHKENALQTL